MRHDPVIVMCFHRSGSTLLTRLLNTSPSLTVWGEHGGFINGLRATAACARSRLYEGGIRTDINEIQADSVNKFIPFMNGIGISEFRSNLRDFITKSFSMTLAPNTRWGFKELRYCSQDMVDWFFGLYPNAQMIFNLRDPVELCTSNIRAPWVLERLIEGVNGYEAELLPDVVYNILIRIATLEKLSVYAQMKYGKDKVRVQYYDDLLDDPVGQMADIYEFLHVDDFNATQILRTINKKVGTAAVFNPEVEPPELEPNNIRVMANLMYEHAAQRNAPPGCSQSPRWNFTVGVMPNDMYSLDTNVVMPPTGV